MFFITGIAFSFKSQDEQRAIETEFLLKYSGSGDVEFSTFYGEIAHQQPFLQLTKH